MYTGRGGAGPRLKLSSAEPACEVHELAKTEGIREPELLPIRSLREFEKGASRQRFRHGKKAGLPAECPGVQFGAAATGQSISESTSLQVATGPFLPSLFKVLTQKSSRVAHEPFFPCSLNFAREKSGRGRNGAPFAVLPQAASIPHHKHQGRKEQDSLLANLVKESDWRLCSPSPATSFDVETRGSHRWAPPLPQIHYPAPFIPPLLFHPIFSSP